MDRPGPGIAAVGRVPYPSELFPTELRSAAVGVAAAASRLAAAAGTFLLPVGLATVGVGPTVLAAAGVCALGALAAHRWAPETVGRRLARTAPERRPESARAAAA